MGLFENKRFTIVALSLLVVLNLVLIVFIASSTYQKKDRDYKDREGRRAEYIAKKLGFSDSQKQAYDSLNTIHGTETRALQNSINDKRRQVFSLSRSENNSPEIADSLASEIGFLVSEMELQTYKHIVNVRALCSPEQLQTLDSLIHAMIKSRRPQKDDGKNVKPNREPPHPSN
ncbi:MAG: periplasmic heavy metal sensor [Balneola sp.]